MSAKPWVICYDISDNKSRQRALYRLRKICDSRQKSVFECWLTESQQQEIFWHLSPLLGESDSLFFVPVSRSREIIRLGQADSVLFNDFMLVA